MAISIFWFGLAIAAAYELTCDPVIFRFNVEKYVPPGPMNTSKVAQRWSFQPGLILPKARKEAVEDHYLIRCVYFMFIVILLLSLSNFAALTAPAVQWYEQNCIFNNNISFSE